MNQQFRSSAARMSRRLMGGMALMAAATLAAWAPAASAQGKANFSNGQTCNFTSFSYNASTQQLDIVCSGTAPPPGPGTFAFVNATSSVGAGSSSNIQVVRNGGTTGSYTVTYRVSNNGLTAYGVDNAGYGETGTLQFGDGAASAVIPFTSYGGTLGSLTFTLVSASGPAATTASGTHTVTVTTAPPPPPPPPPVGQVPGCSTSSNYLETFTFSGQKHVFNLKPGETGSVAFSPRAGTTPVLATTETVNTPASADHQVVVSSCPGDFSKAAPCAFEANYVGLAMTTTTTQPAGWAAFYQCFVPAGQTFYMNVRQVIKGTNGAVHSCNQGSCEVRLQVQSM